MNNKDLYKDTFSQVHTAVRIEMEDYYSMKTKYKHRKSIAVLVAVFCLVLAFSVTAYAMNLFGLKDLVMQRTYTTTFSGNPSENAEGPSSKVTVAGDLISLQGYPDSNEYKAVAEWTAFCDSYDQDGTLLAKVGNGPTGLDNRYSLYLVYTQEMADKLDEIVSKYKLQLHQTFIEINSAEDLLIKTGKGNFLGTANTVQSSYMYEDGTFHIDGIAGLSNGRVIDYQFMNYKKGSFNEAILNIGNADDYDDWSYKTASGVTVSLSISPNKSLIILGLDDAFVTINVLAGTEAGFLDESGKITASDLEAFADTFDFSALK